MMTMKLKAMLRAFAVIGLAQGIFLAMSGDAEAQQSLHTITDAYNINIVAQMDDDPLFDPEFEEMTPDTANPVAGAGTVLRSKKEISFTFQSADLAPGVYTLWLEIFNNPKKCERPIRAFPEDPGVVIEAECTGGITSDIINPKVKGAIVRGTSLVVGADGVGNFSGHLEKGTPPVLMLPFGTGNGLEKPMKAEIHLNVRYHGEAVEGMTDDQISAPNGGCVAGGGPNTPHPALGNNGCVNFQVSYHVVPRR